MSKEFEILWRGICAMTKVSKAQAALEDAEKEYMASVEELKVFDNLRFWVRGDLS